MAARRLVEDYLSFEPEIEEEREGYDNVPNVPALIEDSDSEDVLILR